jgi:hypothetical protein
MSATDTPVPDAAPRPYLARYLDLWSSTDADRRYAGGLVVWGIVALVVAVPELIAAFSGNDPHLWRTISNTTGHLEARWAWVSLIVVGVIASVALYAVVSPHDPDAPEEHLARAERRLGRTPGGRFTLRPGSRRAQHGWRRRLDETRPWLWTATYLVGSALAISLVAYAVHRTRVVGSYSFELTLYLGIALLFIVAPSVAAVWRWWDTPFASLFATVRRLQAGHPIVGCLLVGGLTVLVLHLALYPWPSRCYLDGLHSLNGLKGQLPNACFRP